MRPWQYPVAEVLITDHPRLGHTMENRRRRVVHVASRVWRAEFQGGTSEIRARWECHSSLNWSGPVRLVDETPTDEGYEACRSCDVFQIQNAPSVVYLVDTGVAYKVGCTESLTVRACALKGTAVASIPGSYDEERAVIERVAPHRLRGREWLNRTDDALGAALTALAEVGDLTIHSEAVA